MMKNNIGLLINKAKILPIATLAISIPFDTLAQNTIVLALPFFPKNFELARYKGQKGCIIAVTIEIKTP